MSKISEAFMKYFCNCWFFFLVMLSYMTFVIRDSNASPEWKVLYLILVSFMMLFVIKFWEDSVK